MTEEIVRIAVVFHPHPSDAKKWESTVICEQGPLSALAARSVENARAAAAAEVRDMKRYAQGRPVKVWTIERADMPKLDRASLRELFVTLENTKPDA
ncbi:hypothetical protein [Amycolatopsis saalfeldensis]|uniref:Uncharacterized protein n=1 Tax=Amycolatopsis saalfeldensis TaxID=394193 RepID=A0A1H8YNK7_9PSEU|nr:hypothetical protein [Amycolatopsis saalfeldensis]SEP53673.1 hypothetical protein SAMN04489732_129119 [Amycolatopsis saalfeldensis]